MELEHSFTIPVPVEKAWPVLLDVRQIAPCMPGASVDSVDGDDFTGSVKVKLGPINLTYKGQAKFIEKDESNHKAVIDARGRDARGNGTAAAKITAQLTGKGEQTECKVVTDLNITGKPAQFGRGVMVDVGNKLIGQFADCLAGKLGGTDDSGASADSGSSDKTKAEAPAAAKSGSDTAPAAAHAGAAGAAHVVSEDSGTKAEASDKAPAKAPVTHSPASKPAPSQEAEPIDLLELAGGSVAKRAVPAAAALAALIALIVFILKKK